jgi:hypothetical protein
MSFWVAYSKSLSFDMNSREMLPFLRAQEARTLLGSMRRCSNISVLWREATNFLNS